MPIADERYADVHYEGGVSVDQDEMDYVDFAPKGEIIA